MQSGFRQLPSVDRLLSHPQVSPLRDEYPHDLVVAMARRAIDDARQAIVSGDSPPSLDELAAATVRGVQLLARPGPLPVINATGVIIHTNLGRASLSREALAAIEAAARGYSNLEFDLEAGERGHRHSHVEAVLCQLTGAEAALAVNNNAGAVLLGLTAVAAGKEVVVSRGQAVEIGGGFRIPAVMRQSGATLVEVGTTNRTYLADYEGAITSETAALLRVHTSNFRIIGFTYSVSLDDMVALAQRYSLLLLDDLGSGCLLDTTRFGLDPEPVVQDSVAAGADLVFFSTDKLLGGPQGGVVVGKAEHVERLRRHPLARALRIDKLTLAGLSATLIHHLRGEALKKIPVWRMISMPLSDIEVRATAWAEALGERATLADGRSMIGGGSLPGESLPTKLLALRPSSTTAERMAAALRHHDPPIVARIERDALLFDPRTVLPEQDETLLRALRDVIGE